MMPYSAHIADQKLNDGTGSTGLGSYTHRHAPLIWLKKQFLTLGKVSLVDSRG
jgi:hypothetical protein